MLFFASGWACVLCFLVSSRASTWYADMYAGVCYFSWAELPANCGSIAATSTPTECPNTLSFQLRLKEEELRDYQRAEDEALTKRKLLEQSLKDLEYELEAKSHLKDDRSRLIKQMEVCVGARQEPGCGDRVWATGKCFLCGMSRVFRSF